jgi:hypothetical protein
VSALPLQGVNKVKYQLVSQSHGDREVGGRTSQVPATSPKEEVVVQATYLRTRRTSTIRKKKQLSGHIIFDQMVNSAKAIRRYLVVDYLGIT